jgi:hypothetical protein
MPTVRASSTPWPAAAQAWFEARGGLAGLAETLRAPRAGADGELAEARELLAYWEGRARRLPRWAMLRRREARDMARRWRERVRDAEQRSYGRGLLGAAALYAIERRPPASLAHRGRQAGKVVLYTAASAVLTVLLVLAAALAVIADAVLGAL